MTLALIPAHLLADTTGVQDESLLEHWRWLIPSPVQSLLVTALGDLFFQASDGAIHWLDVGAGTVTPVASNTVAFRVALADPATLSQWFMPDLVDALLAEGHRLSPGQCFSFTIPPTLSGPYSPENLQVTDVRSHFAGMGKLQAQVVPLPLGTVISAVELETRRS